MQHPLTALHDDYASWVAHAEILPERHAAVTAVAQRIVSVQQRFAHVSTLTGIPVDWMGSSFYREADLDFHCSPAQGDRWDRRSVNVPRGLGPYPDWDSSALVAYHIDGIDLVGAPNWDWVRKCYESEIMNGFGYRDRWHIRSPYVVGATNLQQRGKYVRDGVFDPNVMDTQIGMLPIMMEVIRLMPALGGASAAPAAAAVPPPAETPPRSPLAEHDVSWLQASLNKVHPAWTLTVDDIYGKKTRNAVRSFQQEHGLAVDGIAGPETFAAVEAALAA
jgi:lysozyme family protein